MSKSIDEIRKGILTASKGKDVRQLIHDGISLCYEHGSRVGNANLELGQARGEHATLGERLNVLESSINNLNDRSSVTLNAADVVNSLDSDDEEKVLSAGQGKALKDMLSSLVVEHGTNANGEYWKFGDGRLITQKIIKNQTIQTNQKLESLRYHWLGTYNFAHGFIDTPAINITCAAYQAKGIYWGVTQIVNTLMAQIIIMGAGVNTFKGDIVVRAEGRWK